MAAPKAIDILLFRKNEGASPRTHSNYVRIVANPMEVTLQFADLKPPVTDAENKQILADAKVNVPIDIEMVLPFDIAQAFALALQDQITKIKEGKK